MASPLCAGMAQRCGMGMSGIVVWIGRTQVAVVDGATIRIAGEKLAEEVGIFCTTWLHSNTDATTTNAFFELARFLIRNSGPYQST